MSFEITTAFVQQYGSAVEFLAQQKGSRLRSCVQVDTNITGKTAYFDQIGEVAAKRVLNRHGDSPLNPTPHRRRRISMWDYDTGDLIDNLDKLKTLIDPANAYTTAHGWAMGRAQDDEIIAAMLATAYTGEDGSTEIALPASQTIAVNYNDSGAAANSNLTIGKLRMAKELFDASEIDPDEPRYIGVSASQIHGLLKTTEVTNSDYNTVKALVEGKVDTFLGFNFKRTERFLTDSNGYRRCPVWVPSGVKLGIAKDNTFRVTERSDKRFSMYAYACMSLGCTRMQESKVAEILCLED